MKMRRSQPPLSEGRRIEPGRIVGGSAAEFTECFRSTSLAAQPVP